MPNDLIDGLNLPDPGGYPLADNTGFRARQQAQKGASGPGPRVERPKGQQPYRLGPEAGPGPAPVKPPPHLMGPPKPHPTLVGGYDPVQAYGDLRSQLNFPTKDWGITPYQMPPEIKASVGQADTYVPDILETAKVHSNITGGGHTGAAVEETPLMKALQANSKFMLGRPNVGPIPWEGMAKGAGVGALYGATADPQGFTDAATHPLNTLAGIGNTIVDPQHSWAPAFGEGWQRLTTGQLAPWELQSAIGSSLGMKAAAQGGYNMGQTIHKYTDPARFGQGNFVNDIASGMRALGNKVSDAWHDPGGGFGK